MNTSTELNKTENAEAAVLECSQSSFSENLRTFIEKLQWRRLASFQKSFFDKHLFNDFLINVTK